MRGPSSSVFIVSPQVDLVCFVGITLVTLIPWIAVERFGVRPFHVLAAVALANGPHLISTWTRVYLLRRERFRRPLHYWVIPGGLATFAVGCMAAGGMGPVLLRTVIFYWASWHFVSQCWGILRIYQRKHEVVGTPAAHLERVLIYLGAAFFVLHRLYTGPWELFGVQILHPTVRAWMVNALGAVTVGLAIVYVIHEAVAIAHGRRFLWVRPLLIASTAFGFAMPFMVIKSGTSAFAAAALWHAIQYIAIVWFYNRRRYGGQADPDARLLSYVAQPGRSFAYVGLIALCAAGVYSVVVVAALFSWTLPTWSLTVWTALTLGHYYLDGVIWKFRAYDLKPLTATG